MQNLDKATQAEITLMWLDLCAVWPIEKSQFIAEVAHFAAGDDPAAWIKAAERVYTRRRDWYMRQA